MTTSFTLADFDNYGRYRGSHGQVKHVNVMSPSELAAQMDKELAASKNVAKVTKDSEPKVTTSRIRVELSRPLTWAEKEAMETNWDDEHERRINETAGVLKLTVDKDFQHVWAEAPFGSRILYDLIAAMMDQHFVNVYPTAVRTFREYNGK